MTNFTLNVLATDSSLTLFWDKPRSAVAQQMYTVSANGQVIGETNRTHFTLSDLSPEIPVELSVSCETPT